MRTLLAAAIGAALLLSGCAPAPAASDAPVAIATTTQLGSVVSQITSCAGTTTKTLMAPGVDPHEFALSASEAASLQRAKLVVANGLGLEGHSQSVLDAAKADGARLYEVAPNADPVDGDPHVWLDAGRMAKAAGNIGVQLQQATGDARYATCGAEVSAKLTALDADLKKSFAALPAAKRVLITDHEAFRYFASAYGFTIAAVVVPGGSTEAEPSSADLEAVVKAVKSTGVKAIFSNTAVNPKLVQTVSAEAGGDVKVVPLYVDSVGPAGSGAETYESMLRTDARLIVDALA